MRMSITKKRKARSAEEAGRLLLDGWKSYVETVLADQPEPMVKAMRYAFFSGAGFIFKLMVTDAPNDPKDSEARVVALEGEIAGFFESMMAEAAAETEPKYPVM